MINKAIKHQSALITKMQKIAAMDIKNAGVSATYSRRARMARLHGTPTWHAWQAHSRRIGARIAGADFLLQTVTSVASRIAPPPSLQILTADRSVCKTIHDAAAKWDAWDAWDACQFQDATFKTPDASFKTPDTRRQTPVFKQFSSSFQDARFQDARRQFQDFSRRQTQGITMNYHELP